MLQTLQQVRLPTSHPTHPLTALSFISIADKQNGQKWESRVIASRAADFSDPQAQLGLAGSNPHAAQYTGIGAVAMNNIAIPRTGSPNTKRTNSPATVAHSRAASRTNSIGASSMNLGAGGNGSSTHNRPSSSSFSSSGGQLAPSTNNVQVKAEPIDRYHLPGPNMPTNQPGYSNYNPGVSHLQMPPNMNMPGNVPNMGSFGNMSNLNGNAYNASRVPGYGASAGNAPADARNILMLPRGAAPYNPPVTNAAPGGTNGVTKMPQMDGTWDEDISCGRRQWLTRRYPWMAEARISSLNSNFIVGDEEMPQVDGPTPATPPVPPLNLLPPLNLPSSSSSTGLSRDGAPPPLTLPPLNLPLSGSSQGGNRAMHPSLVNTPNATIVEMKRSNSPPANLTSLNSNAAGPSSSFARNPNVPAQPSEDINSDLDDTDDEDGHQEQPGSDPDADVTYCTYDKAS